MIFQLRYIKIPRAISWLIFHHTKDIPLMLLFRLTFKFVREMFRLKNGILNLGLCFKKITYTSMEYMGRINSYIHIKFCDPISHIAMVSTVV